MTKRPRPGDKPLVVACGPLQICKGENFYIGATRATNNTAEMQGVIEALFWLHTCVERETLSVNSNVLITVNSLCVKGLIDGKFIARENRVLATLLCHMWKVTKERLRLHFRRIRGHSGDVGNGIADRLADAGTRQELQHLWWRRSPLIGCWDEQGFMNINREATVCQEALETRWTGPTDFTRIDTASHKFIPALGDADNSHRQIGHYVACSEAWEGCLEQHDPALMEVRRLCVERRCEKENLKRKRLSIALYRARQVMQRKQADLLFKKAVELGAPSRLQGAPPPTLARILEKSGSDGTTVWKICRDALTLSTTTSKSSSRTCGTNKLGIGYRNDGHRRC